MNEKELYKLVIDDTAYITKITPKFVRRKSYVKADPREVRAFIPGIIQEIYVKKGAKVNRGDKLLILEAMKMKNLVTAPVSGTVKSINIQSGKMVTKNELLIELE